MSSDRIWPTGNNDLDKQAFNRSKLRSSLGKRSDTLAGKKSREETESDYPEDEKHFGSGAGKRRKNEYVTVRTQSHSLFKSRATLAPHGRVPQTFSTDSHSSPASHFSLTHRDRPDEITAKIPVKRLGPQSISGITEKPKPIDPRFSATRYVAISFLNVGLH